LFTHPQVWDGIDKLAKEKGWSPSRLAREAGLDPTTFNKSKRHTNQEKPRWPSTESLAKILDATDTPLEYFVRLMANQQHEQNDTSSTRLRCVGVEEARADGLFDDSGFPVGSDWDEINFPGLADSHAFALEVRGRDMLPAYRDGDLLIVSPAANVRRQDRVVVRLASGSLEIGILLRRTAQRLEVEPFSSSRETSTFAIREIAWLSRIVWVSQ
jgi:phage repressor protein C with HTH and peptisase S24 domain